MHHDEEEVVVIVDGDELRAKERSLGEVEGACHLFVEEGASARFALGQGGSPSAELLDM